MLDAVGGDSASRVGLRNFPGQASRRIAAAVVSGPGVSVEEAILPLRIAIIAGHARRERRLIIVHGADALGIIRIDQTVSIVVDAVAAGTPSGAAVIRFLAIEPRRTLAGIAEACRLVAAQSGRERRGLARRIDFSTGGARDSAHHADDDRRNPQGLNEHVTSLGRPTRASLSVLGRRTPIFTTECRAEKRSGPCGQSRRCTIIVVLQRGDGVSIAPLVFTHTLVR